MKFKKMMIFLVSVIVIAGVRIGLRYGMVELEIVNSKITSWDEEFKNEFIKSCQSGVSEKFVLRKDENKKIIDDYGQNYCECMTSAIENAHVIATKYNPSKGEKAYAEETGNAIDVFLASEEGKKGLEQCSKMAIAQSKINEQSRSILSDSFTSNCQQSVQKEMGNESKEAQSYSQSYCSCIIDHVFTMTANDLFAVEGRTTASEQLSFWEINETLDKRIEEYMSTKQGEKNVDRCIEKAKKDFK